MNKLLTFAILFLCLVSNLFSSDKIERENIITVSVKKNTSDEINLTEDEIIEKELENLPLVEHLEVPDEIENTDDFLEKESETQENKTDSVKYKQLDIPGADHKLVQKYRDYYLSSSSIKWLYSVLENGEEYRLYTRQKLKENNMPSVLEYLPVVESSYKTNARSKSGALGLWQFMANSTKPFLERNEFVDERLDPWKSTDAALAKLQENYKTFGDWAIAIAAYNCGAGAMSRTLVNNHGKDFWYLAENKLLRTETAQYIPKLLAIADIAENSEYYNVVLPTAKTEDGEPINPRAGYFDYVESNGSISIKRLAHELKIDEDMLLTLNSSLFRGITPPSIWKIRIPEGMGKSAEVAVSSIKPYTFQTRYAAVAGDSLWGIAKKFGITVKSLCDANNITENVILQIGKVLYIPIK